MNFEIKSPKKCHNIMLGKILLNFLMNIYYILLEWKEKKLLRNQFLRDFNSFMWLNNFDFLKFKIFFFIT